MVKPFRVLLLMLLVNLLLGGMIFLFPEGEIQVSKDIKLQYVAFDELFQYEEVEKADISSILAHVSDSSSASDRLVLANPDSIRKDSLLAHIAGLKDIRYKIEYPDGRVELLYPFFQALKNLSREELIRILHFGDSQIEGDRVTSMLRNKFQRNFGGCGAGMIGMYEVSNIRVTYNMARSPNWHKYAVYGNLYKGAGTKQYSVLGSLFRFSGNADSTGKPLPGKAWVSFKNSG
ncbi:MAG: hypothetical protein M3Q97_05375, partial [Bacteroidota bacterium]|nr:hypothetical protein [Bacteroidota bacterium]